MKKKYYISLFIVLGALAVIFVPILVEKPNHLLREEMAMPLISAMNQTENRVFAKSAEQPRTFRQVPVKVAGNSHREGMQVNGPQAWVVRVAQFSDATGAKDLMALLEKNNLKTFTRTQRNDQQVSTLVYVGPELKKQAAVRLQEKLDHMLAYKTELQAYEPITKN